MEKDLSYRLVGIFFKIHRDLGRFCRERQYCDALELEFKRNHVQFNREYPYAVAGRLSNRVDFVVENKIIIDVKAKPIIQQRTSTK
ncbi:MAG: GxxExxY protein [Candidatus Kerfeldbacteria bacterium]|nr:GxxExxY protein [Candidatus Kerfeldbacteria bacterium]